MAGNTDTDMGLNNAFAEIEKFKNMCVKVGVVEGTDSELVKIAAANELGVAGPPVSQNGGSEWFIPPRPFVKGWADASREKIGRLVQRLYGQVAGGRMTTETALEKLGEFGELGVKSYMGGNNFTPNADSTIKRKGSSQPLMDTGHLKRDGVRYEIVRKPYTGVH
ncbi:hypothetical protein AGMMS49944_29640 [Spirochaetia bacterium]|nr:hypothetical protein AGMMS49944_29640 [Spirochaetia bacterium]